MASAMTTAFAAVIVAIQATSVGVGGGVEGGGVVGIGGVGCCPERVAADGELVDDEGDIADMVPHPACR